MVKGYKTPQHVFAGNNQDFHNLTLDHAFPGEDDWLFDPKRQSHAEPWPLKVPRLNKQPRVIRQLGAKYAVPARVLVACSINSRVSPRLKFWWAAAGVELARTLNLFVVSHVQL